MAGGECAFDRGGGFVGPDRGSVTPVLSPNQRSDGYRAGSDMIDRSDKRDGRSIRYPYQGAYQFREGARATRHLRIGHGLADRVTET